MYELSKDYLSKLLGASGVKLGTAKHAAMVAIIELLDENTLDGLIKAIKADYAIMLQESNNLQRLQRECKRLVDQEERAERAVKELNKQAAELCEQIELLESDAKEKEFLASISGCCEAEKSRVIAYRAALKIGMDALPSLRDAKAVEQVIRSASNVAANWEHDAQPEGGPNPR